LFVEEITRSVLESGDLEEREGRYVLRQSVREFAIPPTLQESLIARLDRLGSAKDVALTASIIGREFAYELIEAISPVPPAILGVALEQLVQSDLLEQRGVLPQSRYIFKHALIQDAAYQSVLRAKRRELHQRIAEVLGDRFPEVAETEPELLAYHYAEANAIEGALAYWRRAAERATSRVSYIEALGHLQKAKTLIEALPEGPARGRVGTDLSGDRRAVADGVGRMGQSAGEGALRQGTSGGREARAPGGSVPIDLGSMDGRAQQRATRESA
jgi:predicted ATPase